LGDGDIGQVTGFDHSDADQAKRDHMHQEFLVKGCGRVTMPGGGLHGMFKIAIEGLDVPAHVIESGQF